MHQEDATISTPAGAQKPLIMLLQGPVGPFFHNLRQSFIARGFDVIKINFNGGDFLFSGRSAAFNFKGSPSEWSVWLGNTLYLRCPDAIVMFGDRRPYHKEALEIAAERGVPVWCLEEGYIRPDFITCERSGNNSRSPLKQMPSRPERNQAGAATPVGNSFAAMAAYASLHAIAQAARAKTFDGNVRHRPRSLPAECAYRALGFLRKVLFRPANRRMLNDIMSRRLRNYYVVALQVHDDLNLVHNGNGWTMPHLIDGAVRWFADYAPAGHTLLFKVHPLDRGHLPYRKLVAEAARAYGCEKRVRIVDDCPIGPMIRHSAGLITVNSTSGLIALEQGKPLLALGDAVYSKAELKTLPPANPMEMRSFWRRPAVAHADDVSAFFDRMKRESLINGSFYVPAWRDATADAVACRIQNELASDELTKLLTMIRDHYRRINDEARHERLAG